MEPIIIEQLLIITEVLKNFVKLAQQYWLFFKKFINK